MEVNVDLESIGAVSGTVALDKVMYQVLNERAEVNSAITQGLAADIQAKQKFISEVNFLKVKLGNLVNSNSFTFSVPEQISIDEIDLLKSVIGVEKFNQCFGIDLGPSKSFGALIPRKQRHSFENFQAGVHDHITFRAPDDTRSMYLNNLQTDSREATSTELANRLDKLNAQVNIKLVDLNEAFTQYSSSVDALTSVIKKHDEGLKSISHAWL